MLKEWRVCESMKGYLQYCLHQFCTTLYVNSNIHGAVVICCLR